MKKITLIAAAACLAVALPAADAEVILQYDSHTDSQTALSRVGTTDTEFVASSGANNTFGSKAIMAAIHGSQSNVQGANGDQNDMQFRFGSSAGGSGTLGGALTKWHVNGPNVDFTYTAAKDQTLTDFSFHLFVNSNNSSSYAARDAGLFVSINSAATTDFNQFGSLDLNGGRGNLGTVTFSDSLAIASGDVVRLRLGFTDRTRTNNDLQAATRIGDVQISAIPEPASLGMIAMVGGGIFFIRRCFMI